MGAVEDYINSLDAKGNIDPLVIASTLLELHNNEMGIATGKIASLETELEAKTTAIAERDSDITSLKAKNWDLATRMPVDSDDKKTPKEESNVDPADATFDDFFVKEED